jgi:hypothetical protein
VDRSGIARRVPAHLEGKLCRLLEIDTPSSHEGVRCVALRVLPSGENVSRYADLSTDTIPIRRGLWETFGARPAAVPAKHVVWPISNI